MANQYTNMIGTTARQKEVYRYVKSQIKENGISPSLQEIADACNFKAKSGVYYIIEALVRKGLLVKDPHMARSLGLPPEVTCCPHCGVKIED